MATVRTYFFVHLADGPVPAGLLTMTDEPRHQFATFASGRRYLARPDRIPVDPIALPLHDPATERTFWTEEGFSDFGGIRNAAPDGWSQYLMYKAMGDRLPSDIDLILASGGYRVGALHVNEFDENLWRLLTAGSSLGGARPKSATEIDGQPCIAKFQARNDSFPECRVDLATMRLAPTCGLDAPALDFRRVLERDNYLIERFDRVPHSNWLERRPFASGLSMLGAHESEMSRYSRSRRCRGRAVVLLPLHPIPARRHLQ